MNASLVTEGPLRTFRLVFDPGDEAIEGLGLFARKEDIEFASFAAIGGLQSAQLGFYNLETKGFDEIPFYEDQVEVLSFTGEITRDENDDPKVHVHTVLGRRDGSALGGHLLRGVVRPILIVTLEELEHCPDAHH